MFFRFVYLWSSILGNICLIIYLKKMWLKYVIFTNADFVRRTLNLQVRIQNRRNMNSYINVTHFKTWQLWFNVVEKTKATGAKMCNLDSQDNFVFKIVCMHYNNVIGHNKLCDNDYHRVYCVQLTLHVLWIQKHVSHENIFNVI